MDAWIGVVGALGGVLVTGLLAQLRTSLQFRREKEWERDSSVRDNLQDLYTVLSEVKEGYMDSFRIATMRLEYERDVDDQRVIPLERMRMLARFYAPELQGSLLAFETCYQQFSDALAATITGGRPEKRERQRLLGDLAGAHIRIAASCDQLMTETVEVAQGLSVARKAPTEGGAPNKTLQTDGASRRR